MLSRLTSGLLLVVLAMTLTASLARAQVPLDVPYQGYLTDTDDAPVSDQSAALTFRLYDQPTGGTELWQESHEDVSVTDGVFSVRLGIVEPFGGLEFDGSLYLSVAVGDETAEQLAPRVPLGAVPVSFMAAQSTVAKESEFARRLAGSALRAGRNVTIIEQTDGALEIAASGGENGGGVGDGHSLDASDGDPVDALLVDEEGRVGIGTESPTSPLTVAGLIESSENGFKFPDGSVQTTAAIESGAEAAWSLAGNAGTDPQAHFLGTSDETPLEIRVGGERVVRYEPMFSLSASSGENIPVSNVIAGSPRNAVTEGVYGATISGGGHAFRSSTLGQLVKENFGTIGGGGGNIATGRYSTVGGGYVNSADDYSFIGGGGENVASGDMTVVAGGYENSATGSHSMVGGGALNSTSQSGIFGAIVGGKGNRVSGSYSSIGGGGGEGPNDGNIVHDDYGTIGGGIANRAGLEDGNNGGQTYATVAGGNGNAASALGATVAGGQNNTAGGDDSTIGGGNENAANSLAAFIGGGVSNVAGGDGSTVTGGAFNAATGPAATTGGGRQNMAGGEGSTIGGGANNTAAAGVATVSGGRSNTAGGDRSTIGGGHQNVTEGTGATVPGGGFNRAEGDYSFAAGQFSRALHAGAFVWSGYQAPNNGIPFPSTAENQFLINATGGVGIGTSRPQAQLDVTTAEDETAARFLIDGSSFNNNPVMRAENAAQGAAGIFVVSNANNSQPALSTSHANANGTAAFFSGRVGIGDNFPSEALEVIGKVKAEDFVTSSDARLKEQVEEIGAALDLVQRLRGVSFAWREDRQAGQSLSTGRQLGFIAQEVAEVVPLAVSVDQEGYYAVAYAQVIPVLVEAVKEQQREIAALRDQVRRPKYRGILIDDLARKHLSHSFVESPAMMNAYNGKVVLDGLGEAWVDLPAHFEALNNEFRYQLTPIGAPGPNLYVAEEIVGNRFRVAGGAPGMEVSWHVTLVRRDRFAGQHPVEVETWNTPEECGTR